MFERLRKEEEKRRRKSFYKRKGEGKDKEESLLGEQVLAEEEEEEDLYDLLIAYGFDQPNRKREELYAEKRGALVAKQSLLRSRRKDRQRKTDELFYA